MAAMYLKDYLEREGLTDTAFAERISVASESVRRYREAERIPVDAVMERIEEVTDGAVTPNDFFAFKRFKRVS